MIRIGLTSFNEHVALTGKEQTTLFEYAGKLPLVEIDTAYYGIPRVSTVENWVAQVPGNFRFVVKLYAGFTGQNKWQDHYSSFDELTAHFLQALAPLLESGKLYCCLAQFPAQFKCTRKNVRYLETLRQAFLDVPLAIELRDFSWYAPELKTKTLKFMAAQKFSLVMVDEPQLLDTVPLDLTVTNPAFTLFRFHGRNKDYWKSSGQGWRKKRTLYRYNETELAELAVKIQQVAKKSQQTAVIFNNNSGGDAADNALAMIRLLGLDYNDLNPSQLDLF
ncbi:DUF72 domain-containing protein [Enterococcus sp. CSURQ0835]|uniref:DUF72 domain-containing protein n=1 Tax=Enterococcus sp. CSURQ0835 TaxID=2681394 RepID=UPI00135C79C5|nr:DUF72 domain-containing protein [Enterococcus sp. CSURQ0835]